MNKNLLQAACASLSAATLTLALLFAAGCANSPPAAPDAFELQTNNTFTAQWSTDRAFEADGEKVIGLFNNKNPRYPSEAALTLTGLPAGAGLQVSFKLYLVGGWESEGENADRFLITSNGFPLLRLDTFPCKLTDHDESKPVGEQGFVDTGKRKLAYWIMPLSFPIPDDAVVNGQISIVFRGSLTGHGTEFWGLGDVAIDLKKE